MEESRIFAFLALMGVVAAAIPWAASQARRRGVAQVDESLGRLRADGFVAEQATGPRGRKVVRVWGVLAHPVAFDLRLGCRSRLARAFGGRSTGMLDPRFEERFCLQSRETERARMILDPEIQRRLLELAGPGVALRLGSFESLLPREYAVAAGLDREERDLRRLWMIQVPGTLAKRDDLPRLGELGHLFAAAVAKHALPPGRAERSAYRTVGAESWI